MFSYINLVFTQFMCLKVIPYVCMNSLKGKSKKEKFIELNDLYLLIDPIGCDRTFD